VIEHESSAAILRKMPLVTILSHFHPLHIQSFQVSSECYAAMSFSTMRFPDQNSVRTSCLTIRATCPTHRNLPDVQSCNIFVYESVRYAVKTKKLNSVAFSPQANYTDRAIAALLAKLVPTFSLRKS
jgi:hypothetical protein